MITERMIELAGLPLNEATLDRDTTDKSLSWDKYVTENPNWNKLELEIERGKKNVPVYDVEGNIIKSLNVGDSVGKLQSTELYNVIGTPIRKRYLNGYFCYTSLGFISIYDIRKPTVTDVMKAEKLAIESLDKAIKAIGFPVTVYMGKYKFEEVVGVRSVSGTPKADFSLYDAHGADVAWISHKKKGGAAAFQQYSGISPTSGLDTDKTVMGFLEDLAGIIEAAGGDKIPMATMRIIKDRTLINKAIFGPDFGGRFGVNNCHIIGQGDPIIKPHKSDGNGFEITFSDHVVFNGDAKQFMHGEYTAVIGATYRNDAGRKFSHNGKEYRKVRAGIYPIKLFKNRKHQVI